MTWPNAGNRPLPGHLQWANKLSQQDPLMAIDYIVEDFRYGTNIQFLPKHRPGKIIVFGGWEPFSNFNMTDLTKIKERFSLTTQYKDYYDYASYLLTEEHWSPLFLHNDNRISMSKWARTGSAVLGNSGITVQLLDTWAAPTGQSGGRIGWSFTATDDVVEEWNTYFELSLLKAWNLHLESLGKKSSFLALAWAGCPYSLDQTKDFSFTKQFKSKFFPKECSAYVLTNYDLVVTYQYPMTMANAAHSVAQVKAVRDMGYQGKIAHILTTDFDDNVAGWDWNADVAYNEYKAVAPYVDYIISYAYTSFKTWNEDYPAILRGFYLQYNPTPTCPALSATLAMSI